MDELMAQVVRGELALEQLRGASGTTLSRAIRDVGLEDAHAIVAALSPAQLRAVLDDDLWTAPAPGAEEALDPERFVTWLQVLEELGPGVLARRLLDLDEELLIGVLCRLFHVLTDEDWRQLVAMSDHRDLTEKRLADAWLFEVGDYAFFGRTSGAELAATALVELHALDKIHCDYVFETANRLSFDRLAAAVSGDHGRSRLDALLSDVAHAREDRRAARGFVAPADARAWLGLLAQGARRDPPRQAAPTSAGRSWRAFGAAVGGGPIITAGPETGVVASLRVLAQEDEARALSMGAELVRLANVLVAGAAVCGRGLRPLEAMAAAVAACDLGLELALGANVALAAIAPAARLRILGPEALFAAGWREWQALRQVAEPVARLLARSEEPEAIVAQDGLDRLLGDVPVHPTAGSPESPAFLDGATTIGALRAWLAAVANDPTARPT